MQPEAMNDEAFAEFGVCARCRTSDHRRSAEYSVGRDEDLVGDLIDAASGPAIGDAACPSRAGNAKKASEKLILGGPIFCVMHLAMHPISLLASSSLQSRPFEQRATPSTERAQTTLCLLSRSNLHPRKKLNIERYDSHGM
jgi:hypothetical protein